MALLSSLLYFSLAWKLQLDSSLRNCNSGILRSFRCPRPESVPCKLLHAKLLDHFLVACFFAPSHFIKLLCLFPVVALSLSLLTCTSYIHTYSLPLSFSRLQFFLFFGAFYIQKDIFWSVFLFRNLDTRLHLAFTRIQEITLLTSGERFYIYLLLRSSLYVLNIHARNTCICPSSSFFPIYLVNSFLLRAVLYISSLERH